VTLSVSYSAVQSWRACEQQYTYRYVDKIRPRVAAAPLELGTLIHDYFEAFYGAKLKNPSAVDIEKAHKQAMLRLRGKGKEIKQLAKIASDLGSDEQAHALLDIPQTAERLMRAYFRVHGQFDLEEHRVVMAERWFQLEVKDGVVLPGKIDMVTENSDGYWLWEHKTTGNIPNASSRFRDLQTLLYVVAVEELYQIKPAGIVWNYIHTRPPHPPQLLKNGSLSVAQNQTTTAGLFKQAIKANDQPLKPYRPFLRKLEAKEREQMFPRYTLPISQAEDVLLRDYVQSVNQIQLAYDNPNYIPVRNITQQCEWCPFKKLCHAVVTGGDTDVLMRKYFTRNSGEKGGKNGSQEEDAIQGLLEDE